MQTHCSVVIMVAMSLVWTIILCSSWNSNCPRLFLVT